MKVRKAKRERKVKARERKVVRIYIHILCSLCMGLLQKLPPLFEETNHYPPFSPISNTQLPLPPHNLFQFKSYPQRTVVSLRRPRSSPRRPASRSPVSLPTRRLLTATNARHTAATLMRRNRMKATSPRKSLTTKSLNGSSNSDSALKLVYKTRPQVLICTQVPCVPPRVMALNLPSLPTRNVPGTPRATPSRRLLSTPMETPMTRRVMA